MPCTSDNPARGIGCFNAATIYRKGSAQQKPINYGVEVIR